MQVVILCGGEGTRIRDVADDIPKPMIPVGGRPLLWHIMKGFAHQGFTDFVLCLGYKSWVIKRYFLDYHLHDADFSVDLGSPGAVRVQHGPAEDNWRVTLAETGLKSMTGCRVKRVEKYLTGDHFLLTYGDGVADVDLHALLAFHQRHGKLGTLTAVQQPGRFGEVELDGPRVVEFTEKPPVSRGRINGGFYVFRRRFLDRLPDDPNLVLEGGPLAELAQAGELMAYLHDGFWQCMDSSRDCKHLNDLWAQDKAAWKTWAAPAPPALRAA
jgi:glucose-1-phosphate cytidylyltransferase